MNEVTVIRRRESDVQAEADAKFLGDTEKVPTTIVSCTRVFGVELQSRYGKAHEIEQMIGMVQGLSPSLRLFMKSLYCDSKATRSYLVGMRPWSASIARQIGEALEARSGGHNGIEVENLDDDSQCVGRDPWWPEDVV